MDTRFFDREDGAGELDFLRHARQDDLDIWVSASGHLAACEPGRESDLDGEWLPYTELADNRITDADGDAALMAIGL